MGDGAENKKTTYFVYAILATLATVIIMINTLVLIIGLQCTYVDVYVRCTYLL